MVSVLEDTLFEPQVIVLSVFGYTNKISEHDLQDNTLMLMLKEIERPPDKLLLPSEGNSSIYINDWADSLGIKTQTFYADWKRNGKMAQILRDDRMYKECTHALVFLSNKSNRLEKFAERMAKNGKMVFTSSPDQTLTQYEVQSCQHKESHKASNLAHKSSKGIKQMLQKYQRTTEC